MKSKAIVIRGAKQHNLKNIDVELPLNKLIVITGLSGSGKSTLAFDILYAEGQRRYVESLSPYARQFLERMQKPDVDLIEGLSPAIAIEQKTASHNPRSTVGTVTDIYYFLRLLFSKIGTAHCHKCGMPISPQTLDQIVTQVMCFSEGTKIVICSPVVRGIQGTHEKLFKKLKKEGFTRVSINGKMFELDNIPVIDKNKKHNVDIIIDRLVIKEKIQNRLADSVELALSKSDGILIVNVLGEKANDISDSIIFSEKAACVSCNVSYPELTPANFSFNSPVGACPKCKGIGTINEFDPHLIIPNPELSLREGAVLFWSNRSTTNFYSFLDALTNFYNVNIFTPFKNLPEHFKKILFYGSGTEKIPFYFEHNNNRITYTKKFEGIIPQLKNLYLAANSYSAKEEFSKYLNILPCPECNGTKLNKESRTVKVEGYTISDITKLSIANARLFFVKLKLKGNKELIAKQILYEITARLSFLEDVGLVYLTLDRAAHTLSGGESQRIRLATQIGSKLRGILYVLDEPSIGLHQKDNQRLLKTLLKIRDLENTVVVVEHDEETILSCDYIIDMGPGAGTNGGQIVFYGTPSELLQNGNSLTAQYVSGRKSIEIPLKKRSIHGNKIIIKGASENNLDSINVEFPLGCFICVTGVSGSGKSTLVQHTLYHALVQHICRTATSAGRYKSIEGVEHIDKVINIDQSPIGKTPRSNAGTYTGVFTDIRDLFSKTKDARMRGYKAGRFSFNVIGGRCEKCKGDGIIKIEMHFLPDVYVTCDVCQGRRYNRETLEIKYKGKNIVQVLDMTVNQALFFFQNIKNIKTKLKTLVDVGIGYIRLGQPATTLSGGEAQRIKLAKELSRQTTGETMYFLDEPTTGLHSYDIQKLLNILNKLVDSGNTVVVIEHNMDVIKTADYIIDLGPDGGENGGKVICAGTPDDIIKEKRSYTGQFLIKALNTQKIKQG